jgi:hypothetical protein
MILSRDKKGRYTKQLFLSSKEWEERKKEQQNRWYQDNKEKINKRMMESYGLVQIQENTSEDNFDLDKESVKKIILKEISIGQIFYPSDISDEYNLDLKMVMDVMSELKENKQIVEKLGIPNSIKFIIEGKKITVKVGEK